MRIFFVMLTDRKHFIEKVEIGRLRSAQESRMASA